MRNRKHLLYMGVVALVVLGGLWVGGVPLERAAPLALLLACPLMMAAMMLFMDHGSSREHQVHDPDLRDHVRQVDSEFRR